MIFASAHLLQHIAATARAFDIIGKCHFNSVRISGMKTIVSACVPMIVGNVLRGKVQIKMIGNIFLRVIGVLRLKRTPVVLAGL